MLEQFKQQIPDYAKDLKLNLSSVLESGGESQLTTHQITAIALASAYATKNQELIEVMTAHAEGILDDVTRNAVKAATSIMAMNNVYYRFVHLSEDHDYKTIPAKLRMNVLANPGVPKVDFELYSLAVSAINGCGMCMASHAQTLTAHLSKVSIQHAVRIAAVITGLAQVVTIIK